MQDDCTPACPADCEWIFDRLQVRPTIMEGSVVEWQLHPQFTDLPPHTYQLQVGQTGSNLADDWQNVGFPAVNVSYLMDDAQRAYGKTQITHYRVQLTTSLGVYYSQPQHCWGDLSFRNWRLLKARMRAFLKSSGGQEGFLLKRRLTGDQPTPGEGTIDYLTEEITNPQDPTTVGTEYLKGYYAPIPCCYMDLSNTARFETLDESGQRGTVNDMPVVQAMALATPQLDSKDVWVSKKRDFRWEVGPIKHLEEFAGVPAIVEVQMSLLPFSHPVYKVPMPR